MMTGMVLHKLFRSILFVCVGRVFKHKQPHIACTIDNIKMALISACLSDHEYNDASLIRASLIRMPHNSNILPGNLFYHAFSIYNASVIRMFHNLNTFRHQAVRINKVWLLDHLVKGVKGKVGQGFSIFVPSDNGVNVLYRPIVYYTVYYTVHYTCFVPFVRVTDLLKHSS